MKTSVPTNIQILATLGIFACTGTSRASLAAHWNLEEGTGTTTSEQVASVTSDTFGAGIAWSASTPGPASAASLTGDGTATSLFGTNRNAQDVGINGSGTKTIVAWFKTSAASSGTTRYLWGWSPTNGLTNGADLRFGVQNGGLRFEITGGAAVNTASLVNDGNWHMAAAIIEAGDTISTIQFYLDGNLITATGNTTQLINTAGTGGAGPPTPNEFYIASNGNGTLNNWIGSLDDVRIYNTALTEVELDAIQAAMAVAPPSPLVWNNASANGLWDTSSANWNNGTSDVAFVDGDEVRFADTAGTPETVSVTGTVAPSKSTFMNLNTNFELDGSGTLGGAGPVLVNGGGSARFGNTGGLSFSGGLLISNSSQVLLATSGNHGSTSIASGSVLKLLDGASVTGTVSNAGSILDQSATGTVTLQGVISGAGSLSKTDASTLVLSGNNTYTGNTVINGGVLHLTGKLYNGAYNGTAVITVNTGGVWKLADYSYNGVGQLADYAARRVLNGGTIEVTGATHSSGQDFTVNAGGGTFRYNPAVTTDTLTLSGNANSNITLNGTLVFDTVGNIAVSGASAVLEGSGGLTKSGAGTLTLAAANTYTGNTAVNSGALVLSDNAQLKFVIGANGVNNKITGAGTADLAGDFNLDLTGAAVATGNSWTLVDVSALTETFQSTFSLVGFSETANVHTYVDGPGNTWTFTEATGILSVATPSGYNTWAATNAPSQSSGLDHDNDGVSNGVEYLLGGLATTNDAGLLPKVSTPGGDLVFNFLKDASVTDATWSIEVGTGLDVWPSTYGTGDPEIGIVPDAEPGFDRVTLTLTRTPDAKKFARLKVNTP